MSYPAAYQRARIATNIWFQHLSKFNTLLNFCSAQHHCDISKTTRRLHAEMNTTPEKLHLSKPGEVIKLAVKRMLPGGPLGKKQLTKLKIYKGSEHPHSAQNPKVIEVSKMNNKNIARV